MISRRTFVGRSVATGALWWTGWTRDVPEPTATLRIGVVGSTESRLGVDGLMLGIDEARASARLFGRELEAEIVATSGDRLRGDARRLLERCSLLVSALRERAQCALLVSEADAVASDPVPVLNAACAADELRGAGCAPHLFHVAASDAMRHDAIRLAHADGARRAVLWHHTLERYGAGQLNARFVSRYSREMGSEDWAAWMCLKIAVEAFLRTDHDTPAALHATLARGRMRFDGHKGTALSFRESDRQLRQPLYVVRAGNPTESAAEVIESPPRDAAPGVTDPNARLDLLGASASESHCRAPSP